MKIVHKGPKFREDWVKGCSRKLRHYTHEMAENALVLMQSKEPDKEFHIYKCKNCSYFHIGSMIGKKVR